MMMNKQKAFANNQVFAIFYMRDIRRTVLPQKALYGDAMLVSL